MIFALRMPQVGETMKEGTVHRLIAKPGDALRPGSPLLEVRVDLGAQRVQDCPPVFFFKLIATERAVLRTLSVTEGQSVESGAVLGVASSAEDELLAQPPARALRTTTVAIQIDPLSRR